MSEMHTADIKICITGSNYTFGIISKAVLQRYCACSYRLTVPQALVLLSMINKKKSAINMPIKEIF